MPRSRNIKPSLFKNELLGQADPMLTILFAGLWCLADREGKLEDRPLRIKAEIFPYRDAPDFNGYLTELERLGFIARYEANGTAVIRVINFNKHQSPHKTEKGSDLPDKPIDTGITVSAPLNNGSITEAAALIPDSCFLIPDSCEEKGSSTEITKPKKKSKVFVKPTIEEVVSLMSEKGLDEATAKHEGDKFINHYDANGWKVGRNAMKDWRATVNNWVLRRKDEKRDGKGPTAIELATNRTWQ